MTDRPNADDMLARAHRAEAEANELRADLETAMDALEAVKDCDLSDPVDYVRRVDAIACDTLAKINGRALA